MSASDATGPRPDVKRQRSQHSRASSRRTQSINRTRISINCYDLLPAGRLSAFLWHTGMSMLHTGVVIDGKEYAYGGHNKPGVSGVYYTTVGTEPPGGVFRCEILQGFTFRTQKEIKKIVKEASHKFQGPQWNLLSNNCNHFTNYLCRELTGRSAPAWINRAASVGVAMPCIVPKAWISPPDVETADGDLLQEDEDARTDEGASMLHNQAPDPFRKSNDDFTSDEEEEETREDRMRRQARTRKSNIRTTDTSGRTIPVSERAPPPAG